MAQFCLECINKINETNERENKYIFSEDINLCEECGKWKKVVVMERKAYYLHKFRFVLLPLYILWRIIIMPYTIYKYITGFINQNRP